MSHKFSPLQQAGSAKVEHRHSFASTSTTSTQGNIQNGDNGYFDLSTLAQHQQFSENDNVYPTCSQGPQSQPQQETQSNPVVSFEETSPFQQRQQLQQPNISTLPFMDSCQESRLLERGNSFCSSIEEDMNASTASSSKSFNSFFNSLQAQQPPGTGQLTHQCSLSSQAPGDFCSQFVSENGSHQDRDQDSRQQHLSELEEISRKDHEQYYEANSLNNSRSNSPKFALTEVKRKSKSSRKSKGQYAAAPSGATQLRGITQRASGKWQAQLFYQGKSRYIGVFETRERAALAYEMAREQLKNDACHAKVTTCVEALKKRHEANTSDSDCSKRFKAHPSPSPTISHESCSLATQDTSTPPCKPLKQDQTSVCPPQFHTDATASAQKAAFSMLQIMQHPNAAMTPHQYLQQQDPLAATPTPNSSCPPTSSTKKDATAFLQNLKQFSTVFDTSATHGQQLIMATPSHPNSIMPHQQHKTPTYNAFFQHQSDVPRQSCQSGTSSPPMPRVVSHSSTNADHEPQQQKPASFCTIMPHHYEAVPKTTDCQSGIQIQNNFLTPKLVYVHQPQFIDAAPNASQQLSFHHVTPHTCGTNQHTHQQVQTPVVPTPASNPTPIRDAYSPSKEVDVALLKHYQRQTQVILASGVLPRGITQRPSGKWQAQLYYAGKSRYIGVFDQRDIAVLAYEIAREHLKSDPRKSSLKESDEAKILFESARKAAFRGVKCVDASST